VNRVFPKSHFSPHFLPHFTKFILQKLSIKGHIRHNF
jgi:hypothetical protein